MSSADNPWKQLYPDQTLHHTETLTQKTYENRNDFISRDEMQSNNTPDLDSRIAQHAAVV